MNRENTTTLAELVKNAAEEHGNCVYVKEKNGKDISEKTFAEFYTDCRKLNGFFAKKNETFHAAIIGASSYNYLVGWFGTSLGGNTLVPLDAQLGCEDICELMQRADVSVMFYDKRYEEMLPTIKAECPGVQTFICLGESESELTLEKILAENEQAEASDGITPDTISAIVYTSGTTGKSKGVMLSHGNFIDNVFCRNGEATEEDVLLTILPIHHVYCFTCDILLSLRYGTTVCVNDSMMRIAQNLKLFAPTIILIVPMIAATIYKQIKAASAAKPDVPVKMLANAVFVFFLKGIYCGGAYLAPELIEAYAELGIPIAQGYGMTECSPRISSIKFEEGSFGDVGIIVDGCEVRIVDGEIVVKSGSVMKGYYKDEQATAKALDKDGWLHTGDLGYVKDNRIYITGRKKNLIILSNGENVSPEELENKFVGEDIAAEVMVYADDNIITAEIVPNPEYCSGMTEEQLRETLAKLINKVNSAVTSSKRIHRLRIRDCEFDKTPSRKIKRTQTTKGKIVEI